MKTLVKMLGALALVCVVFAACVLLGVGLISRALDPAQPKIGYEGDRRVYSELGMEERPLPHAMRIWADYSEWKPKAEHASKFYVASLGGASRQKNFRTWQGRGDTPLGAHDYTDVDFEYEDPHYGRLILSWHLRGKHSTDFLKFDDSFRLYQLAPYGNPNDIPPKLAIYGIEGVRPEFSFSRRPTNTFVLSAEELEKIRGVNRPFKLNIVEGK